MEFSFTVRISLGVEAQPRGLANEDSTFLLYEYCYGSMEQGYYITVLEFLKYSIRQEYPNSILKLDKRIRYNDKYLNVDIAVEEQERLVAVYIVTPYNVAVYSLQTLIELEILYRGAIKTRGLKIYFCYLDTAGKCVVSTTADLGRIASGPVGSTASSVSTYLSVINQYGISPFRTFFRGHPDKSYCCEPSIYRNGTKKMVDYEDILLYEAIRKRPDDFPSSMSTFDTLVKMQHYGMPTRLLDITENPLIALYFACISDFDKNGEVLLFAEANDGIAYSHEKDVCVLSNLARQERDFSQKKKKSLIADAKRERPEIDGRTITPKTLSRVICVLPKMNNERIKHQAGAFYLFGMGSNITSCAACPQPMMVITISASDKRKILKELSMIGIDNSYVFPELENAMKTIREKYSR